MTRLSIEASARNAPVLCPLCGSVARPQSRKGLFICPDPACELVFGPHDPGGRESPIQGRLDLDRGEVESEDAVNFGRRKETPPVPQNPGGALGRDLIATTGKTPMQEGTSHVHEV